VQITIEWLKVLGGDHGGSWAARIKGAPMSSGASTALLACRLIPHFTQSERPMRTSFIPYFGLEGLGSLELDDEEDDDVRMPCHPRSSMTYCFVGSHWSDFS